jgi:hypothetical protein
LLGYSVIGRNKEGIMNNILIVIGLIGLLVLGVYAYKEPSSTRRDTAERKVYAPQEKQIVNFNQSTRKDVHITGGPPADRKISGMDGLRVE